MNRKQVIAVLFALPAMVLVALSWWFAPQLFGVAELPADDIASRLAFAARWLIVPGLTLLAGIVGASRRGFYIDAIDGTRTPSNWGLEINLRYNQNTIEQTVLAAIAWAGLAVTVTHDQLIAIPAMAVLFAIGRITFWIGYLVNPLARGFGMTLTALPTVAAYAWLTAQGFA